MKLHHQFVNFVNLFQTVGNWCMSITMDKASKALRRSGVRIRSIGSGHSDLQMVIAQLKDVRTTGKVSKR